MATLFSFKTPEYNREDYKYEKGGEVDKALQALNEHLKTSPTYTSQWDDQLKTITDKILNREKFSYDFNGDALYQQYKDKYIQQGKMASADVMGQAAAMTGGYGNSYAATVGNQAYQASLQNLNDIVPELYQLALDKYNQEGQDLYNQYGLISDRENTDYGRYRDEMSDWMTNRDYLANRFDSERSFDYGKYSDTENYKYNKYLSDLDKEYKVHTDYVAQNQWEDEFNLKKDEANIEERTKELDDLEKEYNEAIAKAQYYVEEQKQQQKIDKASTEQYTKDLTTPRDWGEYLGAIRASKGAAAAEAELSRALKADEIPRDAILSATRAARGGTLGH